GAIIVLILVAGATILARAVERPIASLVVAADSAARGAFGEMPTSVGPRELSTLAGSFNHMVSARSQSEHRLKALSERLLVVQEEERSRIARELHDDLGQSLTALKMDVIGLLEKTEGQAGTASLGERIVRTLDATVGSVQRISSELRPSILDDLGLAAALEAEAAMFEERFGIECELSLRTEAAVDPRCATPVYRIVQEALTNVARHANATRVEIRLRDWPDALLLEIRDDGRGLTAEEASDPLSFGLLGIRERAALVGGTVQFEGVAGRGTIVSVRIPIPVPRSGG
ncbi:MAG TPA: sensor histidine kinase, partial [Thermoanaerobaculia bacterium]|nr:sensor histidine kinase [Thermoanaerobaculia bacterium]